MPSLVKDDGSRHARLVLIGESPGTQETAQGKPFVGPAGHKWMEWIREVGLQRTDFYVTNCYPYQPPGNKIETVPRAELAEWTERLHERLADLTDPWVLVPTGNTALEALTGKRGITKHRGSIYAYVDRKGRSLKVIPTIHPAAVFRTPEWERRCRHDWARIAGDALFRELRVPVREHFTRPTLGDIEAYVADAAERAETLALDIETPGGEITCIGFSHEPSFSLTIPTTADYWREQLDAVWRTIAFLCALPCAKATHNGHYDTYWLATRGIRLLNWQWDTLAMHHALDAADSHTLAYCASVDTRQPYWKDEAKDPEEAAKYASNRDALWTYNGIDACVTRELCDLYQRHLADRGALGFYGRHYQSLFAPLLSLMRRGVRLNESARRRRFARLTTQCFVLQERLAILAGRPLHGTARAKAVAATGRLPDLSAKKIADYLYDTLKLPKQVDRATHRVTTKETTVRRLMLKYPAVVGEIGHLILDHRRKKKLSEFLDEGKVDADGRLRCTYKFTTETGRLASAKNPTGTGRNLQNLDREIRDVVLPDDGCLFLECDLSQAEGRVVKVLTKAPKLIERARLMPWEYDEHRRAASLMFNVPEDAVAKEQRYIGKRARHAVNYGEGGARLADELLKDGYTFTPEECTGFISAILDVDTPEVRDWQAETRRTVLRDRALTNSWGRVLDFSSDRFDDDLYRRAYAFVPQSEIADLLNQWGLVPCWRWLRGKRSVINLHVHDSLLLSVVPDEVWDVMTFLRATLERPRTYGGVTLTIPVEMKLGVNWGSMTEWKRPPTRDAVEAEVARLTR